jgi:ribosome-associated toxin RatA of RatAB toxin-antitoxin module
VIIYFQIDRYRLMNILNKLLARLVITAIVLIAIVGDARANSSLSDSQFQRLKDGKVLVAVRPADGPSKGMVEATILIDAPAESIWQIMTNCSEIPTFVPGVKSCQVLSSGESWEIIRHEVKWIWLLPKLSYVFRASYIENRQIDFVRIDGDLREMRGAWRLSPLNAGSQTIVQYRVYLDPGFFVPQWLVRRSLKGDLPAVLTSLRTKVLNSREKN